MTPKEKAIELVERFKISTKPTYTRMNKGHAIECALICVYEILNTLDYIYYWQSKDSAEFWQEVKQEINNL